VRGKGEREMGEIGQSLITGRMVCRTQSALSEHNIGTGHQILFDTTIITNIMSYFPRSIEKP